jgi:hypothetical protein
MTSARPIPPDGRATAFCLLACALAALWADLGSLHRLHHGDSLLPVLVSLQRWTPFFWEQDRYGMLIPLLARPVTHPFGNLLVQGFFNVFCGLSAFFLLPRYSLRAGFPALVGAVGAAAFLVLGPALYRFDYLMDANYGVWLTLGLGGLIVAEFDDDGRPRGWPRRLTALGLIVLAHWAYGATAVYLGTLVACRVAFSEGFPGRLRATLSARPLDLGELRGRAARSEPIQALAMLTLGFLAGRLLAGRARHQPTSFAMLPAAEWPHAWAGMLKETWLAIAPGFWPAMAMLGLGALLVPIVGAARGRRGADSVLPWREAAALATTAVVVGLFLGTRQWLKINLYAPRYLIPSVFLIQAAATMMVVVPLASRAAPFLRRRGVVPAAVASLLLIGVATAYGRPSVRGVRKDLDRFGRLTPDVLAAGCTHIAGDYWTVWPAVFHANLTMYERGEGRTVWGVTFRGQPASEIWKGSSQESRCVCIPARDRFGDNWLMSFGFGRFDDVERRPTVRVLRRRPRPADDDQDPSAGKNGA